MKNQTSMEQFDNYKFKVKKFSESELIETTSEFFIKEKKINDALIILLSEIQHRRTYSLMGFSSLFEMLVKHFKLSESSAYQKVSLVKIIQEIPEAKEALLTGSASSSNLVLANSFINEQNKSNKPLSFKEKSEVIDRIKDKSYKKAKEELAAMRPQYSLPKDKTIPINENQINIHCTIDKVLEQKLEHIRNLISHQNPNPTMNELLNIMADQTIAQIEKKKGIFSGKISQSSEGHDHQINCSNGKQKVHMYRKVCVKELTEKKDNANLRSRYISKKVRREVFQRAQGQCQYVSPEGQRCNCKRLLEFEHLIPFAKGGLNDAASLQLFCREHNALKAKIDFGRDPREYKNSKPDLQI